MTDRGKLYICATPIGNLEDMTLRAIRVLKEVDLIAAEDTRVTRKLLSHFGISTRMTSYHEHNERSKGGELVEAIKQGQTVALVSDAGMPGISDPGQRLIKKCIDEAIPVEPIPGPSALVTALVVSGLPTDSFVFQGFLQRKKGARTELLLELLGQGRSVVIYESPRRVKATLEEVQKIDPGRRTVIARELTKLYEEVLRGTVGEVLGMLEERELKGEVVLLFGADETLAAVPAEVTIENMVLNHINTGMTKKDAVKRVAHDLGISKHLVYETALKLHAHSEDS